MCSFATRRREDTGITLFETVPGLAQQLDTHDVLAGDFITEIRVDRGHALDRERFDAIVEWIVSRATEARE